MEASEIEQARKKQYIHKRAEDIRASWLLFCLVGIPVLIVYPFLLVWYWIKNDEEERNESL
jgi:hypothetical protein